MAFDWGKFFDALIAEKDEDWNEVGDTVKKKVYALVEDWIFGERETLKVAVKEALKDRDLNKQEMIGILSIIALQWKDKKSELGDAFLTNLLKSLADGELTATEIAELAANWVATHVTEDENLRDLIKAGVAGGLSKQKVLDALYDWLENRAKVPGLKERIKEILEGAKPVNLRSLVLITASFLIANGKLTKAAVTEEGLLDDLVSAIGELGKSPLADVFDALSKEDYAGAARLLMDELGLDDNDFLVEGLARMFLGDKPRAVVQEFLAKALGRALKDGVTDGQAAELAKTIIGLATGEIRLIPELAERELYFKLYGITAEEYPVWLEVRKILYAAKFAIAGGSAVPADAMKRPHVFAAATVAPDTLLADLAKKEDWERLVLLVFVFTKAVYGGHPRGKKYQKYGPIEMDVVRTGGDAKYMFNDIWFNIYS